MWKTCAQSHRFGLGRVGGGGYHWGGGGGSANREPGSYMAPLSNASDLGIWIDLLLTKVAINRLDNQ